MKTFAIQKNHNNVSTSMRVIKTFIMLFAFIFISMFATTKVSAARSTMLRFTQNYGGRFSGNNFYIDGNEGIQMILRPVDGDVSSGWKLTGGKIVIDGKREVAFPACNYKNINIVLNFGFTDTNTKCVADTAVVVYLGNDLFPEDSAHYYYLDVQASYKEDTWWFPDSITLNSPRTSIYDAYPTIETYDDYGESGFTYQNGDEVFSSDMVGSLHGVNLIFNAPLGIRSINVKYVYITDSDRIDSSYNMDVYIRSDSPGDFGSWLSSEDRVLSGRMNNSRASYYYKFTITSASGYKGYFYFYQDNDRPYGYYEKWNTSGKYALKDGEVSYINHWENQISMKDYHIGAFDDLLGLKSYSTRTCGGSWNKVNANGNGKLHWEEDYHFGKEAEDGWCYEVEAVSYGGKTYTHKFISDNVAPEGNNIQVVSNENAWKGYTHTTSVTVSGKFTDSRSGINGIKIKEGDSVYYNGSYSNVGQVDLNQSINLSTKEGIHNLTIEVTDLAYNKRTYTVSIELDTIKPNMSLSSISGVYKGVGSMAGKVFIYNDLNNFHLTAVASDKNYIDGYFIAHYVVGNTSSFLSCSTPDGELKDGKYYYDSNCSFNNTSPNFDKDITIGFEAYDKASNYGTYEITIVRYINHDRDLKFNDFHIEAYKSHENNLIGSSSTVGSKIKVFYDVTNSKYMYKEFMDLEIGNSTNKIGTSNNSFVSSSKNGWVASGTQVDMNKSYKGSSLSSTQWHNQFKTDDEKYAVIKLMNEYGWISEYAIKVKFDYTDPDIEHFNVCRTNGGAYACSWTNSLKNYIDYSTSDVGSGIYSIKLYQNNPSISEVTNFSTDTKTATFTSVGEGKKFVIHLHVEDKAGNVNVVFYENLHYDISRPDLTSFKVTNAASNIDNVFYINDNNFNISAGLKDTYAGIASISIQTRFKNNIEKTTTYDKFDINNSKNITYTGNYDITKSVNGSNDGLRDVIITIIDAASNTYIIDAVYKIEYDTILPELKYDLDPITSKVKITIFDKNIASSHINYQDIKYYLSAVNKNLKYNQIANDFLNFKDNGADAFVTIPRSKDSQRVYLYIDLLNNKYADYAGNTPSGTKEQTCFEMKEFINEDVKGSQLPPLKPEMFDNNQGYKLQDNGVLVVFSKDKNALTNYTIDSLNNYLNANTKTNGTIIGAANVEYNMKSAGTYAYNGLIFKSNDDSIYSVIDVIVVNLAPIIDDVNAVLATSNIVVNQGEELTNYGVNFISGLGLQVMVEETITLNGMMVNSVNTNVPGTYNIRYVATDEFGNDSYMDRVIVVKQTVSKIIKENTVSKQPKTIQISQELINTNTEQKIEVNDQNQINEIVMINSFNNGSDLDILKGGRDTIFERAYMFTFKLFSKYFFKVYDG